MIITVGANIAKKKLFGTILIKQYNKSKINFLQNLEKRIRNSNVFKIEIRLLVVLDEFFFTFIPARVETFVNAKHKDT